jgi:hypothetical protein
MNKYYKNVEGNYISSISTGTGGEEITQKEYQSIREIVRKRPTPAEGFDYKLRTDLTWELVEVPTVEAEEGEEAVFISE